MKKSGLIFGLVMVTMLFCANNAEAQKRKIFSPFKATAPIYNGTDIYGMTTTDYTNRISPRATLRMGVQNRFSPQPIYTYSNRGVLAQRTNTWNQGEAASHPWNEQYMNWRWREPTALVVPPTAAYESSYAWGVGQVRSTPIHSQFGSGGSGGGALGGLQTPYHPSHTKQFGLYPVRAPW